MTLVDLRKSPTVSDPGMAVLLSVIDGSTATERLGVGMYAVMSFNFDMYLSDILVSEYPFDPFDRIDKPWELPSEEHAALSAMYGDATRPDSYGVCDTPQQLVDKYPILNTDPRPFVVSFTRVAKADQPPYGGWRWHKWGAYIGDKNPEHEYLHDEGPDITEVWCYHIYEVKPEAAARPDDPQEVTP